MKTTLKNALCLLVATAVLALAVSGCSSQPSSSESPSPEVTSSSEVTPSNASNQPDSDEALANYEASTAAIDKWWAKIPEKYRAKVCETFNAFPSSALEGYRKNLTSEQNSQLLPETFNASMATNCIDY